MTEELNKSDNEFFQEDNYTMPQDEKFDIQENIKRKYVRKQPKKPQTDAQKLAFEKARATLLQNRESKNARKSVAQNKNPSFSIPKKIKPVAKLAPPKDDGYVYDDEFEDKHDEEAFMISSDNNATGYRVTPIIKRSITVPFKRNRNNVPKVPVIKRKDIENIAGIDKLNNIVETQINNIDRLNNKKVPSTSTQKPHNNIHKHNNIYEHSNIYEHKQQPIKKNPKSRTLLDDDF